MQYYLLDDNETLTSMSRAVGQQAANEILVENGIPRTPRVRSSWDKRCSDIIGSTPKNITSSRKIALLNGLTGSEEIFEKACLMDDNEWKVFSATQSFMDALKIPSSTRLTNSTKILGFPIGDIVSTSAAGVSTRSSIQTGTLSSRSPKRMQWIEPHIYSSPIQGVSSVTYKAVMQSLKVSDEIDPAIFNNVNTGPPAFPDVGSEMIRTTNYAYSYNLPWGKIQMYSTLLQELMDFPVYPEQIEQNRSATYTEMPDIIYQYEPWITFQNSGPREQALSFHMHRDMWTGNHLDGRANQLIRFCESNTFADYNGSAVLTPLVRFYIDGSLFISGVLKSTNVTWSGPIGLDNWYLEFTISLAIQEISETPLNIHTVRSKELKEG